METLQIQQQYQQLKNKLPKDITLVAVSKFHPITAIQACYEMGQRHFAESRVQELQAKVPALPADIHWHFIGHLQRNKVKAVVKYASLIQAVDSLRLLKEIDKCALQENKVMPCLLQLHLAEEDTKFGLTFEECRQLLQSEDFQHCEHIRIDGIMTMATHTDDAAQIEKEFALAAHYFERLQEEFFKGQSHFKYKSWGMSEDYSLALRHGANILRIGTSIFGPREY